MKSAYELAMERLDKTAPTVKLTVKQKKELAELDSKLAARIAEREIGLKSEIEKSAVQGDFKSVEKLQQQLASEKKSIQAEFEEKKQRVRDGKV